MPLLGLLGLLGACNGLAPSLSSTSPDQLEGTIQGFRTSWTVYVTTKDQIHGTLTVDSAGRFRYPLTGLVPQHLAPVEDQFFTDSTCGGTLPAFNPPGSRGTGLVLAVFEGGSFLGYLFPTNPERTVLGHYFYVNRATRAQGQVQACQGPPLTVDLNFRSGWNYWEVQTIARRIGTAPPLPNPLWTLLAPGL
jgi:hypothetical protein